MPSKKKHTKKSVSKNTKHTAKASANSSPMNTSHSVEYCGVCRNKVKVSNITFVDLKVKNGTIRKRMVYMCVNHGHKWGKFVSSKTKTVGNSNNKKMVHTGGSAIKTEPQYVPRSEFIIRNQPLYNVLPTDVSQLPEPTFREQPPPPRPPKTSPPPFRGPQPPPLPLEIDNNLPSTFLITNPKPTHGSGEPTHQTLKNARTGKTQ